MLVYKNKEFRNLQEQVYKNMSDIQRIKEGDMVLGEFGIRVVGQESSIANMPSVADYKENNPDWQYGDAYAIGEEEPYNFYLLTRANGSHPSDYWLDIGTFPQAGPQGPQGETGPQGPQGQTGNPGQNGTSAGFGTISVTTTTLDPEDDATVNITTSGPDSAMNIEFEFGIPKGEAGAGAECEWGAITGDLTDQTDLVNALQAKQNTLVSGTNIKTINSESLLGSGNISVPVDSNLVHKNIQETITAKKTFSDDVIFEDTITIANDSESDAGKIILGKSSAVNGYHNYLEGDVSTYRKVVIGVDEYNASTVDHPQFTFRDTNSYSEFYVVDSKNSNLGNSLHMWNDAYIGGALKDGTNTVTIAEIAKKSEIPTEVSQLTNDSGFITGIDSSDVISALGYTPGTSNFSGSYTDLTDKPSIPSVSGTNDGTNWTSITINSDTYAIPSGGGGGGAVNDVEVNGTSVVTAGVAEIDLTNYVTLDGAQTISGNKTLTGSTSFGSGGAISISGTGINVYSPATIRTYGADVILSSSLVLGSSKIKSGSSDTYGLVIPTTTSYTANKTIATTDQIPSLTGYATETWVTNQGYLTSSDLSGYATETWVGQQGYLTSVSWNDVSSKPTFATVATSGDYDDLIDKPTIPTATSDLNNDSGFITSSALTGYAELAGGTSDSRQEFTGYNKFNHPLIVTSNLRVVSSGGTNTAYYYPTKITCNTGGSDYDLTLPSSAGTLALTSDIPSIPVTDVTVGGTSVVSSGVAVIPAIPDTTYMVTTNTNQTITGDKTFSGEQEFIGNTLFDDYITLTNSTNGVRCEITSKYPGAFAFVSQNGRPIIKYSGSASQDVGTYGIGCPDTSAFTYNKTIATTDQIPDAVSGTNDGTNWTSLTIGANTYAIPQGGGSATDVQINGTSIVSGGVANIVTNSAYNASSNKIATMSDLPSVPTSATTTVTASSETFTFTYADGTTTTKTFLTAITSATTTLS